MKNRYEIIKKTYRFFMVCMFMFAVSNLNGEESFRMPDRLETFWDIIRENNAEIKKAGLETENARNDYASYKSKYLPQFSLQASSAFDNSEKKFNGFMFPDFNMPQAFSSGISYIQNLPGNFELSFSPSVSFAKNIIDLEKEQTLENIEYIDSANFTLSLETRTFPYWVQGYKGNPEKNKLNYRQKLAEVQKNIQILEKIKRFNEAFFHCRICLHQLESVKKRRAFQYEKRDAYEQLLLYHKISYADYVSIDEEIANLETEYESISSDYNNYVRSMVEILNYDDDKRLIKFLRDDSKDCVKIFSISVPEKCTEFFSENPVRQYYNIQKEILEADYILDRQNNSPVVKVSGNFPFHNGSEFSKSKLDYSIGGTREHWSVGIAVDFSPLIDSNASNKKKTYQNSQLITDSLIEAAENQLEYLADYYTKLYEESRNRFKKCVEIAQKRRIVFESVKEAYKNKDCSYIDYRQMQVSFECSLIDIEEEKDLLWLYKWMSLN